MAKTQFLCGLLMNKLYPIYPKTRIEIKIVAINSWIENVWTYPLFNLSRSLPLYINHEHIWFNKTYSYLPDFITIHFKLYISGEKSDFPWSYSKQSVSLIDTICKNTYFCKSANSCWFENLAPSSIIFILFTTRVCALCRRNNLLLVWIYPQGLFLTAQCLDQ